MGSLWPWEEEQIRDVIRFFPNNPIIVFPQSVYFDENELFKSESIKTYQSHKSLKLCVREKNSFKLLEGKVEDLYLIPDMVLYLEKAKQQERSDIILWCFRNDKESVVSSVVKDQIRQYLKKYNLKIVEIDTVLPYNVSLNEREKELEKIWGDFSNAKLVLTDRLHGMLFSYITKTPCVAVDNINKKVSGVYDWIRESNFVSCVEAKEELIISSIEKYLSPEFESGGGCQDVMIPFKRLEGLIINSFKGLEGFDGKN